MLLFLLCFFSLFLLLLDGLQTLDIKNHPELHEINVVLGPHPKDWKVVIYFLLVAAFLLGLYFLAPVKTGVIAAYCALTCLEVIVIINNHKLGLRP